MLCLPACFSWPPTGPRNGMRHFCCLTRQTFGVTHIHRLPLAAPCFHAKGCGRRYLRRPLFLFHSSPKGITPNWTKQIFPRATGLAMSTNKILKNNLSLGTQGWMDLWLWISAFPRVRTNFFTKRQPCPCEQLLADGPISILPFFKKDATTGLLLFGV